MTYLHFLRPQTVYTARRDKVLQGDHLSGKPGMSRNLKHVREKILSAKKWPKTVHY